MKDVLGRTVEIGDYIAVTSSITTFAVYKVTHIGTNNATLKHALFPQQRLYYITSNNEYSISAESCVILDPKYVMMYILENK